MNKVFLSGRITSDITTFGSGNNAGAAFSFVTSENKLVDGKPVKDENGYNETYDEFHDIKVFNGLSKAVANHKKKGDKLNIVGAIRKSKNEKDGKTFYNFNIIAHEIEFI